MLLKQLQDLDSRASGRARFGSMRALKKVTENSVHKLGITATADKLTMYGRYLEYNLINKVVYQFAFIF